MGSKHPPIRKDRSKTAPEAVSLAVFTYLRKIYKNAAIQEIPGPGMPQRARPAERLSEVDKKILKVLLQPNGKNSSVDLEKKLGVPRSTIQRRRRHLEREYLEFRYVLNLSRLGFRRVDLFISTGGGGTGSVAKELMRRNEVVYVGSSVGEHTIDLRAEIIIGDNSELLDVLERVKAMPGVRDVVWSEIVQVLGRKLSIPASIIDNM